MKAKEPTLRELRESIGMSQEQLGREIGYSARQIARWEKGDGWVRPGIIQFLKNLQPKPPAPAAGDFTFIDLFAGIGGFRKGFESVGGRCVFASEKDSFAQVMYMANFGPQALYGDIAKIKAEDVPDHDILLASFPCEAVTKGSAFFHIERILDAKRPEAFVLETTKNLASRDDGRTFEVIRRALEETLGYRISVRLIDAKSFLPLYRERAYIVGTRADMGRAFDWRKVDIPDPGWGPTTPFILHRTDGTEPVEERYTDERGRVLPKYVLTNTLWTFLKPNGARQRATGKEAPKPLNEIEVARTFTPRYYKDGSEILIRRPRGNPRRLTPRECARLMGFDDVMQEGVAPFRIVVSDTQAYKQFGGATVVPIVAAIARVLAPRVAGSAKAATKRRLRSKTAVR